MCSLSEGPLHKLAWAGRSTSDCSLHGQIISESQPSIACTPLSAPQGWQGDWTDWCWSGLISKKDHTIDCTSELAGLAVNFLKALLSSQDGMALQHLQLVVIDSHSAIGHGDGKGCQLGMQLPLCHHNIL